MRPFQGNAWLHSHEPLQSAHSQGQPKTNYPRVLGSDFTIGTNSAYGEEEKYRIE